MLRRDIGPIGRFSIGLGGLSELAPVDGAAANQMSTIPRIFVVSLFVVHLDLVRYIGIKDEAFAFDLALFDDRGAINIVGASDGETSALMK